MNDRPISHRDLCQLKLETIVREISQQETISMDADLVRDLGLDSVAMMRFIIEIEETFGVMIGGREIETNVLKTCSSLLDFILTK